MPKKHLNNEIPKELQNLEKQFKRALRILTGFVVTVLALALIGVIYSFYLPK
jgi:cell division septal protein FtsQ